MLDRPSSLHEEKSTVAGEKFIDPGCNFSRHEERLSRHGERFNVAEGIFSNLEKIRATLEKNSR
jgi:hypothetical protein